jgi:hypothetical protein
MDELNLLSAKVILETTYLKTRISLDEIKEKHPTRTDIINSMERTLKDLQEAKCVYDCLEKEYRSAMQSCFRLEKLLQEEKFKNKDLQSQLNIKDATL